MYGYENDEPKQSSIVFGLNAAAARMIKFEWINNAGKDGAEAEAIDVLFAIDGMERPVSYRLFPVTKAFGKDGVEITDPKVPEFQKAVKDLNSCVTHILHCFADIEAIKNAFSNPIPNFKEYAKICMSILPKEYEQKKLDIFFQWEWQIKGENTQTYLRLPNKMSYGKWLAAAIAPSEGSEWKAVQHKDPTSNTPIALKYVDGANNIHPFQRNGWFMLSNFAKQQRLEENSDIAAPDSPEENPATKGW